MKLKQQHVEVTEIRMKLQEEGNKKAVCDIVVNGQISIMGIMLIEDNGQRYTAFPVKDMENGNFKNVVEAKRVITASVWNEYNRLTLAS